MKNYQRILSMVLILAMLFPMSTYVYGANIKNTEKANTLNYLGMLDGRSPDFFDPALQDSITRQEAMKMLGEVLGWDIANAPKNTFTDVTQAWAKPYVALAKELGVSYGTSSTTFNPSGGVTYREMLAWVLRLLNYDDPYPENATAARAQAVTLGLITNEDLTRIESEVQAEKSGKKNYLIRDDVVGLMYQTLFVKAKGKDVTVLQDLADKNSLLKIKAMAKNLLTDTVKPEEPVVVPLAVKNVTAPSYRQIVIELNQAPSKGLAENIRYYTVSNNEVVSGIVEGNTIQLLLKNSVGAYGNIDLVVRKEIGLETDYVHKLSNIIDNTPPTVKAIELVGPNTFILTFNETLLNPPKIEIQGVSVSAYTYLADNIATVTLGRTLADGNYTVRVTEGVDLAGNKMKSSDITLQYKKDTSSVTAAVVSSTPKQLVVRFNQKLKKALTRSDFYYMYSGNTPASVTTSDNRTYTLYFDNPILAGNRELTVKATNILSEWNNKAIRDLAIPFTVEMDEVPPELLKIDILAEDMIELTFDKSLDRSTAERIGNYTIVDSYGRATDLIKTITYRDITNTVVITFVGKLPKETYTITVRDILDGITQGIPVNTKTMKFSIMDKNAPVAKWAEINEKDKTAVVYFDKELSNSALNLIHWQLGNQKPIKAVFTTALKNGILLTFENTIREADVLTVTQIADANGNTIKELLTTIPKEKPAPLPIISARTTAQSRVEIVIGGKITNEIKPELLRVYSSDGYTPGRPIYVVQTTTEEGYTRLVVELPENITFKAGEVPKEIQLMGDYIISDIGERVTTSTFTKIEDGIRPTVKEYGTPRSSASDVLTITFDESLRNTQLDLLAAELAVYVGNMRVNPSNYKITLISRYTTNDTIQINLNPDYNGGRYLTAGDLFRIEGINLHYLKDLAGNAVADFSREIVVY